MDPAVASLYARVKERVPQDEFERRIAAARGEFGGLLDDEALALLVLDELGLNEGAYTTLAELKGRSEATVRVRVERVEPPRTFERAGRDPGRVVNVVVSDATGETRLVFWDKDVDRAEELKPGAHLTVVNARVKDGRFGAELHVGPWSVLEVEGALDPAKRKLLADVGAPLPHVLSATAVADAEVAAEGAERELVQTQTKLPSEELPTALEGTLAWLGPTRPYRSKEGATGFTCELDIATERGPLRVVAWDAHVKAARALREGAPVRIEGLAPKVKGATTEWHTTRETRFSA
ncbi:MAG TPA: OB-fold nucleic acid binding domain-containing protein [Candidatus Thermoplasmatota archaeon]|nr:OB-fold nucleic acid binding domain-containing protein [Candidatus Thermoplasmatota archaeon]